MARVLIAESDQDIREALLLLLEYAGYEVETASSRDEALDLLTDKTFQLILTDSFAERGNDVLATLRPLYERARPTPVGVITAWRLHPADVERTMFAFVLSMPFEVDQLLAQVAAALNSPLTPEQEIQAAVVRQYFAALSAHDWDALISLCTPDVTYMLPEPTPFAGIRVGREAFRAYTIETFEQFVDARFEDVEVYSSPAGMASRYRGSWRLTDGSVAAMTGAVYFRFQGDRIQQIGVLLSGARLRALMEHPSIEQPSTSLAEE
ncbi:MAG TPA: nuclear transport factor 2 family protein [Ktedonobacterales bacterium]|nr:nuclear transport factor 2 family protein [Ktedonobacterales bacterium]